MYFLTYFSCAGDSGYPLRNYFLTPLLNPVGLAEQRYNEAHIRTRNAIERLFGNWKRRFPVLAYGIRLKLETAAKVIVATAVLQNIARAQNELDPPPMPNDINDVELNELIMEGNDPPFPAVDLDMPALYNYRNNLIQNYFMNL